MIMAASDFMLRLTEAEFQQMIIDRGRLLGWLVYHTHDSRRSAAGFPDLVLCRDGRVIFAEVKSEKGKLSKAQLAWLYELKAAVDEAYVWRPSEWGVIERVLASDLRH